MDGNAQPGIADDSDQLTTYALASLVLDKKLPDLMVLDYLIYTPARHDTKYVPTRDHRDMNDIKRVPESLCERGPCVQAREYSCQRKLTGGDVQ
jgi:hypothetical protein